MTPTSSLAAARRLACRLLLSALLAVAAPAAWAQAPSDADINRLLAASRAQTMLDTMLPQIEALQQQQFAQLTAQRQLDADQQAQLQRIQERTRQTVRKALSWSELRPMYVDIYKRSFSREDVLAMGAWHPGRRWLQQDVGLCYRWQRRVGLTHAYSQWDAERPRLIWLRSRLASSRRSLAP